MGQFIQQNVIWIAPTLSVVLTIIIKIVAKHSEISLSLVDFLDFGFALAVTSIIMILTNFSNDTGPWLIAIFFILVFSIAIIVNRLCWDKENKRVRIIGVIIPDIMGIAMLVISVMYIEGGIK